MGAKACLCSGEPVAEKFNLGGRGIYENVRPYVSDNVLDIVKLGDSYVSEL